VCLEMNRADRLEDNSGPIGALFHGISTLYCMTTSLANGGAGFGTRCPIEHVAAIDDRSFAPHREQVGARDG
jgi:hypothetical protein